MRPGDVATGKPDEGQPPNPGGGRVGALGSMTRQGSMTPWQRRSVCHRYHDELLVRGESHVCASHARRMSLNIIDSHSTQDGNGGSQEEEEEEEDQEHTVPSCRRAYLTVPPSGSKKVFTSLTTESGRP